MAGVSKQSGRTPPTAAPAVGAASVHRVHPAGSGGEPSPTENWVRGLAGSRPVLFLLLGLEVVPDQLLPPVAGNASR